MIKNLIDLKMFEDKCLINQDKILVKKISELVLLLSNNQIIRSRI